MIPPIPRHPLSLLLVLLPLAICTGCLSGDEAGQPSGGDASLNLVAVLTDYGTAGSEAGALEGAIYAANQNARISTITHLVRPFDVAEGSYLLSVAAREYPAGTVFVAGVDPGVGTRRRAIVLESKDKKLFVGPDNGIFTGIMDSLGVSRAFQISNRSLMRSTGVSSTFHGRDIYGPVAAHLAGGVPPELVGPQISDPVRLNLTSAFRDSSGLHGSVVHIDTFGNLMTNIPGPLLQEAGFYAGEVLAITVGDSTNLVTLATTYGDVQAGSWVAMTSSEDMLQISINKGSAAEAAAADVGDSVWVSRLSTG
ncbi:MAG TPA: SAM-dependent chlorinase/fluorinase [Methanotrichaceae archaeon]|nr:SAM-dependent chlorinase/fluorinase [Methanotrichaceae archaeon]